MSVDRNRIRKLNNVEQSSGAVVYWMSRDQRIRDNWTLLYAQELALELKAPMAIVFCLVPSFLGATLRQYAFMLKGLRQVESAANELAIPFHLLLGEPVHEIQKFVSANDVSAIITDFTALKINRRWKDQLARELTRPLYEVDAHNVVPCWIASPKQEYAARTIRPKIHRVLGNYLTEFPGIVRHPYQWPSKNSPVDWERAQKSLVVDTSISEITDFEPGEVAAQKRLDQFIREQLNEYDAQRNSPNESGQSGLSPYLHFGQISAQRVALEVMCKTENSESRESFLEELIVRRELSDNYCHYNPDYDSFDGFPNWARTTLDKHREDPRQHHYSYEQFERAATHDQLWNAAQMEMVTNGKMHGFMRMYWAKKILEWSETPEVAIDYAIKLNDRYELDGRDPNGYTGIAWSIGGVHDRPWQERPIFGMIRYMSYDGCARKFDVKKYIARWMNSEK